MEEEFYATIKLRSGEEIFTKVSASEETDNRTFLILFNPIIITEVKHRNETFGYKVEPWLKTTSDDTFIIRLDDVITINESSDLEVIMMYQSYLRQSNRCKNDQPKLSREMGYISNVNDAKEVLERIYKGN